MQVQGPVGMNYVQYVYFQNDAVIRHFRDMGCPPPAHIKLQAGKLLFDQRDRATANGGGLQYGCSTLLCTLTKRDQRLVLEREANFTWFSGFSTAQKQRPIQSLHGKITATTDCKNILEISSKSEDCLGRSLSAFTLPLTLPDGTVSTVECAFSK